MVRPQFRRLSRVSQGRAVRRGFTLLEVMLVMMIIIMLAGLTAYGLMGAQDTSNENIARIKASTYADACKRFKIQVGRYPQQLQDLVQQPQGVSMAKWRRAFVDELEADPWGNPYQLKIDPTNNIVVVYSAGIDGKENTEDDISSQD